MSRREDEALMIDASNPFNRAVVALKSDDSAEALRCWREARSRYPQIASTREEALTILLGLALYDEAETLMREGMKRQPRNPYFQEGLAKIADKRGDREAAAHLWDSVRRRFPTRWMAYVHCGNALRDLGRATDADRLMQQAVARFPEHILCRIEWARAAEASGNWELAAKRWNYVHTRLDHIAGVIGEASALDRLGRIDEAIQLMESLRHQHGGKPEFYNYLAELRNRKERSERAEGTGE